MSGSASDGCHLLGSVGAHDVLDSVNHDIFCEQTDPEYEFRSGSWSGDCIRVTLSGIHGTVTEVEENG